MKQIGIVIAGIILLAGCASPGITDGEMLEVVEHFISDESLERQHSVSAFRLDEYAELNDQYLLLKSSSANLLLVKLEPRCTYNTNSSELALSHSHGTSLNEGIDYVHKVGSVIGSGCIIKEIYPLTTDQHDALISKVEAEAKNYKPSTVATEKLAE